MKFISYAVWWIRQSILASLARHGRTVRVPLNRTADLSRIIRTAESLRQELRREPTPEEIASSTGLSLEVVQALAALNTADVRLDAPDRSRGRPLADRPLHRRRTGRSRNAGDGQVPLRGSRERAPHPAAAGREGRSVSTSASTAAASTPSRRSAASSASPASGYASSATAHSSASAKARSAGRSRALRPSAYASRRGSPQRPTPSAARDGFVTHVGRRSLEAARALADVRTWLPAGLRTRCGASASTRSPSRSSSPSLPASSSRSSPRTSSPAPCRSTSSARWWARRS